MCCQSQLNSIISLHINIKRLQPRSDLDTLPGSEPSTSQSYVNRSAAAPPILMNKHLHPIITSYYILFYKCKFSLCVYSGVQDRSILKTSTCHLLESNLLHKLALQF